MILYRGVIHQTNCELVADLGGYTRVGYIPGGYTPHITVIHRTFAASLHRLEDLHSLSAQTRGVSMS